MNWIKVTPETMPKDNTQVIVTVEENGERRVLINDIWYNPKTMDGKILNGFYRIFIGRFDTPLEFIPLCGAKYCIADSVTHWMLYPGPAED